RGTELLNAETLRIGFRLFPLIKRQIQIKEFNLIKPKFHLERDKEGRFNFETPGRDRTKRMPAALESMKNLNISKGSLVYLDKKSGEKIYAGGVDLKIRGVSLRNNESEPLRNISFSGDVRCRKIETKSFEISDLKSDIKGERGLYAASPATMKIFGGNGKGNIQIDMTGKIPVYNIHLTASKFSAEKFLATLSLKKMMRGDLNISADLSMKGKSRVEMYKTLNGDFSLRGINLTLLNLDLDQLLSRYEKTQTFNLVDLGAFLLVGPLGTVVTRGYSFAAVMIDSGKEGTIRNLVSDWRIRDGVAEAEDVALATKKTRLALKGRIDLINNRFQDVTLAVLDGKGCARLSQKIHGSFRKPRIEKVSKLRTITGPFLKLLEKTKEFLTGERCEIFYSGSVPHPE
ncbi:MAG: AsmA family protein, partial [Nitrospirota bacterium]